MEDLGSLGRIKKRSKELPKIINLEEIEKEKSKRKSAGFEEFDRVLGGGIVAGSLVLLSGEPGIGKSTLLTQLTLNIPNTLYVSGEESAHQIKLRADRIKPKTKLSVLNETDVDLIIQVIDQERPPLVIIDSIQVLQTSDLASPPGSISQVRECAYRLQMVAKSLHIPIFLVGHVTKEGVVAGPKTLEHLVDVVLSLEGDPLYHFRILRASKNRFGSTDEVGIFDMTETGFLEVKNPSKLFLEQRVEAPGSAIVPTLSGLRPLLLEIQALVTKTQNPIPRRAGSGVDLQRLQLLVAVLSKRLKIPLFCQDIFVNVTGGLRVVEPAADLAICMAIVSSFQDRPLSLGLAFIGEVGLLGEVRQVKGMEKRIKEAKKLGFEKVIGPYEIKTLKEATELVLG